MENSANSCNDAVGHHWKWAIIRPLMWRKFNKRVGAAAANDLEPLMKLTHKPHEPGGREGKKTWFKINTRRNFGICTLFPLMNNKGIGWVDLDQGFAPARCMDACILYSCLPACLLKNSDTGATTVVQLGYHSRYCFCFVQCCQPKPRKDKTIGGLCFGRFRRFFVFVVVASRTKWPARALT
jgi:hypothetical protein